MAQLTPRDEGYSLCLKGWRMKKAKNHTGPRYDVYLDYYGGFMWKARVFQGNYLLTSFDAFSRKGAIRKAKRHVSRIRKNDRYKAQNSNHLML